MKYKGKKRKISSVGYDLDDTRCYKIDVWKLYKILINLI
jgi:hypothetical protein